MDTQYKNLKSRAWNTQFKIWNTQWAKKRWVNTQLLPILIWSYDLTSPPVRGTDKPLFGVFKQLNLWNKQLFSNEGVTKSNLILEKAIVSKEGVTKSNLILEKQKNPKNSEIWMHPMCGSQFKPSVLHHSFVVMNSLSDIYHNHLLTPLWYKQVIC